MRKLTHGHSTWTLDIRNACGSSKLEYIISKSESILMTTTVDRGLSVVCLHIFIILHYSNKYA